LVNPARTLPIVGRVDAGQHSRPALSKQRLDVRAEALRLSDSSPSERYTARLVRRSDNDFAVSFSAADRAHACGRDPVPTRTRSRKQTGQRPKQDGKLPYVPFFCKWKTCRSFNLQGNIFTHNVSIYMSPACLAPDYLGPTLRPVSRYCCSALPYPVAKVSPDPSGRLLRPQ